MTSFCFFVQLADRTLILKQKEFFVFIIATRLLWNHSPSEWFSLYKNVSRAASPGRQTRENYFVIWNERVMGAA